MEPRPAALRHDISHANVIVSYYSPPRTLKSWPLSYKCPNPRRSCHHTIERWSSSCDLYLPSYLTSSWAVGYLALKCSNDVEGTNLSVAYYLSRRSMLIASPIHLPIRYVRSVEVTLNMTGRMAEYMKVAPDHHEGH